MITFQVERFSQILEEGKPIFAEHWAEIARHRERIRLNPDYDKYLALDAAGVLHTVTARDDGVLCGYFLSFVVPHMHYQDCIMSLNDILYLQKPYRAGWTAVRFFRAVEGFLRDAGVQNIHISMKLANDFGPILQRLGYTEIERTFEKLLEAR